MEMHFDEKGKIFTQVISKHPISVSIQTIHQLIRGTIHVRPDLRVKDDLNGQERFIAVTDAVVYNNQNEEIYKTAFMVVNVEHVVWIIPVE